MTTRRAQTNTEAGTVPQPSDLETQETIEALGTSTTSESATLETASALGTSTTFEPATLESAKALGTSTLFEACPRELRMVDPALRPAWPGACIAGPAYPVACAPGDNLALHVALEIAPAGCVLVASTQRFLAGYWGEVMTVAAQAAGITGLVIDGGVRDVAALQRLGFPVFASGVCMKGTRKDAVPSVGEPIVCADAPVAAGDLVVGDADGVVVIPRALVAATVRAGKQRASKEDKVMAALKQGKSTLELFGLSSWSRRQHQRQSKDREAGEGRQ